jgi:hypothetical protein
MAYERPQKELRLSKDEKRRLLKQYFEDYKSQAATDSGVLNQKLPREALNDLLNALGEMLLAESKNLASKEGQVRTFLDKNPLSPAIEKYLSPEFGWLPSKVQQIAIYSVATHAIFAVK